MAKKLYSAFVSSVYESLRDERQTVIDCLLDSHVFPICMEHFTVSSHGKFEEIEERIDDSDIFILILGRKYGSLDEQGISWTEREYRYAVRTGKQILALVCDEADALRRRDPATLSEDEARQLAFVSAIPFARTVPDHHAIRVSLTQFLAQTDMSAAVGWSRNTDGTLCGVRLEKFRAEHAAYDLGGTWYHLHLSADDPNYIRCGTVQIWQEMTPSAYCSLFLEGYNYNVRYHAAERRLSENKLQYSHWTGNYRIDEATGAILGVYSGKREFTGNFGEHTVAKGVRRGIHDFYLDVAEGRAPDFIQGAFHDEAPSPKIGVIYLFRTPEARLAFLESDFPEVLESIQR